MADLFVAERPVLDEKREAALTRRPVGGGEAHRGDAVVGELPMQYGEGAAEECLHQYSVQATGWCSGLDHYVADLGVVVEDFVCEGRDTRVNAKDYLWKSV